MGKELVMPKTLLLKTVAAPLISAMHAMVSAKKPWGQADVSTSTITVITMKMANMTASEDRTRTPAGTLARAKEAIRPVMVS